MSKFYYTNNFIYYINNELCYWHKFAKSNYEINKIQSNIISNAFNFDFLYNLKSDKSEFSVFNVNDTLTFFKTLKRDKNTTILNLKKGVIYDYNKKEYSFIDLTYNYKGNVLNEKLVFYSNKAIRFVHKKHISNIVSESIFENFILETNKLANDNFDYFSNSFFDNNEYLINSFFLNNNNIDSLSLIKNSKEITYLINNFNKNGNYKLAQQIINNNYKDKAHLWNDNYELSDFNVIDIKNYCNNIDSVDILMINDHHLFESSRYGVAIFLQKLKDKGFKYFAAESFISDNDNLNFDIKEDEIDGYYVRQPTYGLLTHYAYLNRYILCGYDSSSNICENTSLTNQQCRDSIQASNIAKIYEYDKNAKIVVFGGHSHINKIKNNNFTPMGYYLNKALPEKKIISINQVTLINNYGNEKSLQFIIADSLQLKEPKVIESQKHFNKVINGTYDAYLIHPNNNPLHYWYYSKNNINTEKIKLKPPKAAFYIEIIPVTQIKNNICVFKSLINDLHKNYIYLPKSNYKINYYNSNNSLIHDLYINKL